jgi:hypothetical protein
MPRGERQAQAWGRIAVQRILATLRRRYGKVLSQKPKRDESLLELMAYEICENSAAKFDSDLADPESFMDQFAGEHLRWESLGLLFAHREMAPDCNGSDAVPPRESPCRKWETRDGFLELWPVASRTCLNSCIEMARCFCDGNSLMMLLTTRLIIIDSLAYGNASKISIDPTRSKSDPGRLPGLASWPSLGAAISLSTYLGLHALPDPPDYRPNLASEIKRRCFALLFMIDKVGASFHGRPPLLNQRYTLSPLPLHIRDEDLLAGGEALNRAVDSLDTSGWSTEAYMGPIAMVRCRTMLAKIKDELMEIALGSAKNVSLSVIRSSPISLTPKDFVRLILTSIAVT